MDNIDERLDRIERKLDALMAALRSSGGARGAGATAGGTGTDAPIDADIDGPRGDPDVRFVPKRWSGTDFKGQKFSACEPEFLDMLADAYEWFAQRDDESGAVDKNGGPKSRWSRLDGARARAWAARLRGDADGLAAPAPTPRARPAAPPARRAAPAAPPMASASNGRSMGDFGAAEGADDDIPF